MAADESMTLSVGHSTISRGPRITVNLDIQVSEVTYLYLQLSFETSIDRELVTAISLQPPRLAYGRNTVPESTSLRISHRSSAMPSRTVHAGNFCWFLKILSIFLYI